MMAEIAKKKALKKLDTSQIRDSSGVKTTGGVVGAGSGGGGPGSGGRPSANAPSNNNNSSYNAPRPKVGGQMTMQEEMAKKQAARMAKLQGGGNNTQTTQRKNDVQLVVEHVFTYFL